MKFEIISTPEGFLSLENEWTNILKENNETNFYLSFEWFYAVFFLSVSAPESPYLICIRAKSHLLAIIPTCIKTVRLRIFNLKALEIIGTVYSPFRGAVVKRGHERDIAEGLSKFLLRECQHSWDVINLEGISRKDPFINALIAYFDKTNLRYRLIDQFVNVINELSSLETAEAYWKSLPKKHRGDINRKINILNRLGDFDIVLIKSDEQDVDAAMAHYYQIYSNSWKQKETDPTFHLKLAKYLVQRNWLRLFILYVRASDGVNSPKNVTPRFSSYNDRVEDDRPIPAGYTPVATFFFIVFGRQAYELKSAYRRDHSKSGPGVALHWFAMEYLIEEDKVNLVDRQKGVEDYKFRWGGTENETRIQCIVANEKSFKAKFELWNERWTIPKLRRVKQLLNRVQSAIGRNGD